MTLYAENISIQQSEQVIILKYAALDFYEVNQKIEQDIVDLIQKNTASYAYSFPKLTENLNELSDAEIASVMNPARLTQLLNQADAFTRVNSEDLDDF